MGQLADSRPWELFDLMQISLIIYITPMLHKMPSLNLTGKCLSSVSAPHTARDKLSRRDTIESEIQILENDTKLVKFQYFKKKEMFCTVSRQKDKLQFFTDKNSILLGLWINHLTRACEQQSSTLCQQLQNEGLELEMLAGVPLQFVAFNNSTTMRLLLLRAVRQLINQHQISVFSYQKTFFQMLYDYPFLAYCAVCYIRARGVDHLRKNLGKYELEMVGNEEQLLRDYSRQLRNMPLEIIADSLSLTITILNDLDIEVVGSGQSKLNLEKIGCSFYYSDGREIYCTKSQTGSELFKSTVTSSTHEFEQLPPNKICSKCLSLKRGKFCDCRKNKTKTYEAKKHCQKCQTNYIFVCKCYLDQ